MGAGNLLEANLNRMTREQYFSDSYAGHGIRLRVDPVDRIRSDDDDNVLGIFEEEQPLMWELFQDELAATIKSVQGQVDFLDVGAGSGFWAIIVAKHFGGNILGIDKALRAITFARQNALLNGVEVNFRHEKYNFSTVSQKSVKAVYLNPPYHIYPESLACKVPQHARGGGNGFEEFEKQLGIAAGHLAPGGKIFFHHMCLGDTHPFFLSFASEAVGGKPSIEYVNIFPPISTRDFLERVYTTREFSSFIDIVSVKFPRLFFTDGVISMDGKASVMEKNLAPQLAKGRTWEDRVQLHRAIAEHLKKDII